MPKYLVIKDTICQNICVHTRICTALNRYLSMKLIMNIYKTKNNKLDGFIDKFHHSGRNYTKLLYVLLEDANTILSISIYKDNIIQVSKAHREKTRKRKTSNFHEQTFKNPLINF